MKSIAQGYGIAYQAVTDRKDLAAAVEKMLSTDGPFLLECAILEALYQRYSGNEIDSNLCFLTSLLTLKNRNPSAAKLYIQIVHCTL